MHECGRLERVAGLLARHLRAGKRAQLGIDLCEQCARGVGFAAVDGVEEECEVGHWRVLPDDGAGGEAKVGGYFPDVPGSAGRGFFSAFSLASAASISASVGARQQRRASPL